MDLDQPPQRRLGNRLEALNELLLKNSFGINITKGPYQIFILYR
jgi:hypothetical protein